MFDMGKFKSLVHYVCWRCEDPTELGSTKLNKVVWHADFEAYRASGESITGATYVKRQFGPVPKQMLPALTELKRDGVLAMRQSEHFGHEKMEFFALQSPSLGVFNAEEISLVDQAIEYVCRQNTARSISAATHDDIWKMAAIGEEIPYFTVFASRLGEITEDDIEWVKTQAEELRA